MLKLMEAVQTMSKIVNNESLFNDFKLMISKHSNKQINIICLHSPKGKGKTTVINYFYDYCLENDIICTLTDFNESYQSFNCIEDFFDNIIFELGDIVDGNECFSNYYREINNQYAILTNSNIALEKVKMVKTSIGNVSFGFNSENKEKHFNNMIADSFFKDLKKLKKKIVIFIDHFEVAPQRLKEIIIKYFLKNTSLKPNIFIVIATEDNLLSKTELKKYSNVEIVKLPEEYKYDDWKKFCIEIRVDEKLLQPIFNLYKNDPLRMRIALKPHEGSSPK